MTKQRRYLWSAEELSYLGELIGDYPANLAITYYQDQAAKRGWPKRSRSTIRWKIQSQFGSSTPIGVWITTATLRELVGITNTTIDKWVQHGYLKPQFFPSPYSTGERPPRRYFKRADIVQLARKKPRLFGGVSRTHLFLLLENPDLADYISTCYPYRIGRDPKPVVCVETGKRYSSMTEAAKAVYCHRSNIHNAVSKGHRASGLHWRWHTTTPRTHAA